MATFTFSGIVKQDIALLFTQIGNGEIREGQATVISNFGDMFTQSTPPTLTFSVAETSAHISNVGLRYGTSGNFASSITLTKTQAADLSLLQMSITAGDVTTDQPFDITITATDP